MLHDLGMLGQQKCEACIISYDIQHCTCLYIYIYIIIYLGLAVALGGLLLLLQVDEGALVPVQQHHARRLPAAVKQQAEGCAARRGKVVLKCRVRCDSNQDLRSPLH